MDTSTNRPLASTRFVRFVGKLIHAKMKMESSKDGSVAREVELSFPFPLISSTVSESSVNANYANMGSMNRRKQAGHTKKNEKSS